MEAKQLPTVSVQNLVDKAPRLLTDEGQSLTDEGQTANTSGAYMPIDEGQDSQHMGGHQFGVKPFKIKDINRVSGLI